MAEGTKAISRRLFLGLAAEVLSGCAASQVRVDMSKLNLLTPHSSNELRKFNFEHAQEPRTRHGIYSVVLDTSGVDDEAYNYLTGEFKRKGLHNLDSPLFDFNDKEVREAYEKTKNARGILERDLIGKINIETAVKKNLKKYGDRSLILISGAGFHVYGLVETLEKLNTGYISVTPRKLDFYDVIQNNGFLALQTPGEEIEKAREVLAVQLERANGAVRYYGYDNLKEFVRKASDKKEARNIAVGIEETGLHNLYTPENTSRIYFVLGNFLEIFHPRSILFLREDRFFNEDQGREDFLRKAKRLGIPFEIEAF